MTQDVPSELMREEAAARFKKGWGGTFSESCSSLECSWNSFCGSYIHRSGLSPGW